MLRTLIEHYISKLDSSDPEEAVICGGEEITHFIALQNKAVSYHTGNTTWIEITITLITEHLHI